MTKFERSLSDADIFWLKNPDCSGEFENIQKVGTELELAYAHIGAQNETIFKAQAEYSRMYFEIKRLNSYIKELEGLKEKADELARYYSKSRTNGPFDDDTCLALEYIQSAKGLKNE